MFKDLAVYDKEAKIYGIVIGANFLDKTYIIINEDGEHVVNEKDAVVLSKVFETDEFDIFDKDVIDLDGYNYLVEAVEDGMVRFGLLDEKYKVVEYGETAETSDPTLKTYIDEMKLIGSLYELKEQSINDTDFNVKVVKAFDGKHYTYQYACNKKVEEKIDLIKVVFIGHHLIEEEEYERTTISYGDFKLLIESGQLVEVSEQEFKNFALGITFKDEEVSTPQKDTDSEDVVVEEEEEELF